MSAEGVWIVFEGGDRVGKSTQVETLLNRLLATGRDAIRTRDPGGTPHAEVIRDLIVNDRYKWRPETDLLLFTAARCELLADTILPNLAEGRTVICDRFKGSTWAYQGTDEQQRSRITALDGILGFDRREPDLTVVLDGGETSIARIAEKAKSDDESRFERKGPDFHREVQGRLREFAEGHPNRRLVSANGTVEEVADRVWSLVRQVSPELEAAPVA